MCPTISLYISVWIETNHITAQIKKNKLEVLTITKEINKDKYINNIVYVSDEDFWFTKNADGQITFNYRHYSGDFDNTIVTYYGDYVIKHMTQNDIDWMKSKEGANGEQPWYNWLTTFTLAFSDDPKLYTHYKHTINNDCIVGVEITNDDTGETKTYYFDENRYVYVSADGDKIYEARIYSDCDPIRAFLIGFVHAQDLTGDWYEELVEENDYQQISDTVKYLKNMNVKY